MDSSISMDDLDVSLDDIMHSMIESRDMSVVTCECKSTCSTRKCPCRGLEQQCIHGSCQCGKKKPCKNGNVVCIVRTYFILDLNIPVNVIYVISNTNYTIDL